MAEAAGRAGWSRTCALLASTSVAALLIGIGTPPALAACPTTITGNAPACANRVTITRIAVTAATVSGSIFNTGTISPNGITIDNQSTISGSVIDRGLLNGGISNAGTISGQGTGNGIDVTTLSTFTGAIINNGTITAPGVGIWSENGPAFSNGISNARLIAGAQIGVQVGSVSVAGTPSAIVLGVSSFGGGITNSGTISVMRTGILVSGVSIFTSGVTNAGSGLITGGQVGMQVGSVGFVGTPTTIVLNVSSFGGGITNSGTISAHATGILVSGVSTFTGGVTNAGLISGAHIGINIGTVPTFGILSVQTFSGGVTNLGAISVNGVGIELGGVSTFIGGITNIGTISGARVGIALDNVSTFSNGVINNGTIFATMFGISIGTVSAFSGGVTNGGTISGAQVGISLDGVSTFAGGIFNNGAISAATGIFSENGPAILDGITNGGLISVTRYGIRIGHTTGSPTNLVVGISSFGGSVTNSGRITFTNAGVGTGILVDGVSTFAGGITNIGTIAGARNGIQVGAVVSQTHSSVTVVALTVSSFAGGIVNSGTIAGATTGNAVGVSGVSTFAGGITNAHSGVISGFITGVQVGSRLLTSNGLVLTVPTFSGGITNSGTMVGVGPGTGVSVSGVSTFSNGITNTGTISEFRNGIQIGAPTGGRLTVVTFAGGVVNAGTMIGSGGGTAISVNGVSTFSNGITNSGTISGFRNGIEVGAPAPSGAFLTVQTFSGGVTNIGTIAGTNVGIFLDGVSRFSGGVTNAGTITGVNVGIWSENGPSFANGISNGGAITATNFGIRVGGVGSRAAVFKLVSRFTGGISNSGIITVTDNNGVGIYVGGASTFTGGISNTGTITAGNTGIWAAAGATKSENGPGGIYNGGFIGAGQAGIRVGGVVAGYTGIVANRTLAGFSGGVSNAGTISVGAGPGVLLSQISTFLGGITNSGTINAATGIVINSSVLRFLSGAISNTGTITGTGGVAIDLSAARNGITINQSAGLIAGNVKLSVFGDTFNITGGAVAGDIIGPGANGDVNFAPGDGNSFTYLNAITGVDSVNVQSGTLFANNAFTAATSVTVNGGATLAPGLPGTIGTLTVNGTLAFQPGAFYLVQVTPSAASSTTVNGTAALAGTVEAAFAPGAYLSRQVSILHASGGFNVGSTTFDGGLTTINMPGGLQASLGYGTNDVFLDLTATGLAPSTAGANDQNVSAAIGNFFNNGGTLPPGFVSLFGLSGQGLTNALTQLDGEVGASGGQQAGIHLTNSFLTLLLNGFFGDRSTLGGFGPAASAYASAEPSPLPQAASAFAAFDQAAGVVPVDGRHTFWASAYGGQATASGDAALATNDTRMSAYGIATGLDYRVSPDALVGFALAGASTGWNVANGLGGGSSDVFQAGVYGTRQFGASYVSAAAAYAWYDMSTKRSVTVSGTDTLTADFHANNLGARIEAGHHLFAPFAIGITPYVAAQVQGFWLPAYGETAASGSSQFALSYAANAATAERAELGAWFDTRALIGGSNVNLFSRLAWAHDWNDDTRVTAVFQALPGASFVVNGAAAPQDVALVTAGAGFRFNPAMSVSVKFDGEFANAYRSYAGTAIFRYGW